jgi:hypothetical protein
MMEIQKKTYTKKPIDELIEKKIKNIFPTDGIEFERKETDDFSIITVKNMLLPIEHRLLISIIHMMPEYIGDIYINFKAKEILFYLRKNIENPVSIPSILMLENTKLIPKEQMEIIDEKGEKKQVRFSPIDYIENYVEKAFKLYTMPHRKIKQISKFIFFMEHQNRVPVPLYILNITNAFASISLNMKDINLSILRCSNFSNEFSITFDLANELIILMFQIPKEFKYKSSTSGEKPEKKRKKQ